MAHFRRPIARLASAVRSSRRICDRTGIEVETFSARRAIRGYLVAACAVAACGGASSSPGRTTMDGGADAAQGGGNQDDAASGVDASVPETSALDASGLDASGLDASGLDASGLDASDLDAGLDAPPLDAQGIDAAGNDDGGRPTPDDGGVGGCFHGLASGSQPTDIVSVRGQAGALGMVDVAIAGYSAGAGGGAGGTGLQRFTNSYYGERGTPTGISEIGLWLWPNQTPVAGMTYAGDNSGGDSNAGPSPLLDFRILYNNDDSGVSCPAGAGTGTFVFTRFEGPSMATPIEGTYEFHCPTAGIDVTGCFHYES